MLFCDGRWPDFVNNLRPDYVGATGIAEPRYLKAVTGKDLSFEDGIGIGRKIWNLINRENTPEDICRILQKQEVDLPIEELLIQDVYHFLNVLVSERLIITC